MIRVVVHSMVGLAKKFAVFAVHSHSTCWHSFGHIDVTMQADNDHCVTSTVVTWILSVSTDTNLNRLVALIISSLTASLRFDGVLNVDINRVSAKFGALPLHSLFVLLCTRHLCREGLS